ncbi:unnamed protein product [Penicillium olsonii]|uniref:TMEM205-like domain-containing protein n=1 Tax=Penicillium olsonii TaxID=99116 RepID=A0A9W4N592_PENOL|nr:unnamed protein product [Penicillium olsonii]CAG8250892.1 unnamed protein product [Penicillium olsonii]CAG8258024.1 unnamed protein product [Penicillium olsonii]
MDNAFKAAGNLLPYHLLAYGALLGTELFQARPSFFNTKICYRALPMKEFIALQKQLFPVYFKTQVGLAALTAATHPPYSIFSLIQDPWSVGSLAIVGMTGCLNWFIYGPRTITASLVRRALQGKMSDIPDSDPDASRIHRADRSFTRNHAMAVHLNAISIIATILYGFSLSARVMEARSAQ